MTTGFDALSKKAWSEGCARGDRQVVCLVMICQEGYREASRSQLQKRGTISNPAHTPILFFTCVCACWNWAERETHTRGLADRHAHLCSYSSEITPLSQRPFTLRSHKSQNSHCLALLRLGVHGHAELTLETRAAALACVCVSVSFQRGDERSARRRRSRFQLCRYRMSDAFVITPFPTHPYPLSTTIISTPLYPRFTTSLERLTTFPYDHQHYTLIQDGEFLRPWRHPPGPNETGS